jgi:glycosyltransferase involved in cell wall biosynthesis
MESNLVTVIIPTFRKEQLFSNALASVLSQSYKNIEILIVDDNYEQLFSNYVVKVIEKHQDSRIKYIKTQSNLGSAESRNLAFRNSKGEFITFLDDDDFYLEKKVEVQLRKMKETNSDFSIMNSYFYKGKKLIGIKNYSLKINQMSQKELIAYHLQFHLSSTNTLMFKRDFFIKVGGFPKIDIGDEFFLVLNSLKYSGKFFYINEILVKATINSFGVGLSMSDKKIKGQELILNKKLEFQNLLNKKQVSVIYCRHHLVLTKLYFSKGYLFRAFSELCLSMISSPTYFIYFLRRRF